MRAASSPAERAGAYRDFPPVSGSGELVSVPALATPPGLGQVIALLDTDLTLDDRRQRLALGLESAARTGELNPDAPSAQRIASGVEEALGASTRSGVVLAQTEGRILVSPLRGGVLYRYRNPTAEHALGRVEVYDHAVALENDGDDGDLLVLGTSGLARHLSGFEVRRALLAYDYEDAMMWLLWLAKPHEEAGVGVVGLRPGILAPLGGRGAIETGRRLSPGVLLRPLTAARALLSRRLMAGGAAAVALLLLAATVLTGRLPIARPLSAEGSSPATPPRVAATRPNPPHHAVPRPTPPKAAPLQRVHPAPVLVPTGLASRQIGLDELLSWHSVPGATAYLVHLGHRQIRSPLPYLRLHGTIRPKVTYHWSVRAIFPHGSERSSATAHLQMSPAPAPTWHFHQLRRPAENIALLVQNPGTVTVQVTVTINGPGASTNRVLSLPSGTTARVPLPLAPPADRSVPVDVVSAGPVLPMTVVSRGKTTEVQYGTPLMGASTR